LLENTVKDTLIKKSDTIQVDYTHNGWIGPCLDCFFRIEAIEKDKEECEESNNNKIVKINKIESEKRELEKKVKNRNIVVVAVTVIGIVIGFL
jgi:hypothetical protein